MRIDLTQFNGDTKAIIAHLIQHKSTYIEMKKAEFKHSEVFNFNSFAKKTLKMLNTNYSDDEEGVIKRDIVANTYNWMDSHYDVHVGNTFSKSIQERIGKIWHLHDHEHKITAKVGEPEKFEEKTIDWVDLGVNKNGNTTSLVMTSNIMKSYNELVYNQYLTGKIDQHSVGMIYVKLALAVNDPEYKEEYAEWEKYYPMLGNPEKADKVGYFWAIKEAKLIETSAVLEGSNELTGTVINEPLKDTQTTHTPKAVDDDSHRQDTKEEKYEKLNKYLSKLN